MGVWAREGASKRVCIARRRRRAEERLELEVGDALRLVEIGALWLAPPAVPSSPPASPPETALRERVRVCARARVERGLGDRLSERRIGEGAGIIGAVGSAAPAAVVLAAPPRDRLGRRARDHSSAAGGGSSSRRGVPRPPTPKPFAPPGEAGMLAEWAAAEAAEAAGGGEAGCEAACDLAGGDRDPALRSRADAGYASSSSPAAAGRPWEARRLAVAVAERREASRRRREHRGERASRRIESNARQRQRRQRWRPPVVGVTAGVRASLRVRVKSTGRGRVRLREGGRRRWTASTCNSESATARGRFASLSGGSSSTCTPLGSSLCLVSSATAGTKEIASHGSRGAVDGKAPRVRHTAYPLGGQPARRAEAESYGRCGAGDDAAATRRWRRRARVARGAARWSRRRGRHAEGGEGEGEEERRGGRGDAPGRARG